MLLLAARFRPGIAKGIERGDQHRLFGQHRQREMGVVQFGESHGRFDGASRQLGIIHDREQILEHVHLRLLLMTARDALFAQAAHSVLLPMGLGRCLARF
jgi:hypothetical protein